MVLREACSRGSLHSRPRECPLTFAHHQPHGVTAGWNRELREERLFCSVKFRTPAEEGQWELHLRTEAQVSGEEPCVGKRRPQLCPLRQLQREEGVKAPQRAPHAPPHPSSVGALPQRAGQGGLPAAQVKPDHRGSKPTPSLARRGFSRRVTETLCPILPIFKTETVAGPPHRAIGKVLPVNAGRVWRGLLEPKFGK